MRAPGLSILFAAVLAATGCRRGHVTSFAASHPPAETPKPPAALEPGTYGMTAAEKATVDAFLKSHADLRMAADADARSPDADLLRLYGVYHPYFVRGDVNDDGILDFVVAFVRRDSPAASLWFSVVVFPGLGKGGFDTGVFLERDVSLADGDLSVDRDSIVITPDVSDDANRRYRWDAVRRQFRFVRDDEEPTESPPVART